MHPRFIKLCYLVIYAAAVITASLALNWNWSVEVLQMLRARKYHFSQKQTVTTTPSYSVGPKQCTFKLVGQTDFQGCKSGCSWQRTISNKVWRARYGDGPDFDYDSPRLTYPLDEPLQCLPKSFGYSKAAGDLVFPDVSYPRCSDLMEDPSPKVHLDLENHQLSMNCSEGRGQYVIGPVDSRKFVLPREADNLWKVHEYPGHPVSVPNLTEFALASCDMSAKFLDQAVYHPHFNSTLFNETKQRMEALKQKRPPLVVLMMTIDSFSRNHFYRKLPLTLEWLEEQRSTFSVVDFLIHNIIGSNSVKNQGPIFGKNLQESKSLDDDFAGQEAIWYKFKEKVSATQGFVTNFALEACDENFPKWLGRKPKIDYVINPFYCAAYKLTACKASMKSREQRCIGPEMSHQYIFNYTETLTEMYGGLNQWHYLHVDAAHETTGAHAATLDLDMKTFLSNFVALNAGSEVVVFLAADHGMRYGAWYRNAEAFQENRLPAFFLMTQNSIVDSLEGSLDTLFHNSLRLTSKLDLRKTLTFLTGVPYGLKVESHEVFPAFNLYTHKIPSSRSCQDAGIPLWHCSCLELIELETEIFDRHNAKYKANHPVTGELDWLLNLFAESTITHINDRVYTPKGAYAHSFCQRLTLSRIVKAYALNLDPNLEEFKLELTVKEKVGVRFEVTLLISTAKEVLESSSVEGFAAQPIVYNGYRQKFRVSAR
jgi:hypothetical protein